MFVKVCKFNSIRAPKFVQPLNTVQVVKVRKPVPMAAPAAEVMPNIFKQVQNAKPLNPTAARKAFAALFVN